MDEGPPPKKAKICEEHFPMINQVLPPEMLKKILGMLGIKDLCSAGLTCKRWKQLIDNCNLLKEAIGK